MNDSKPLIAVVDDDESVRRALKRLLQSLGLNAETFSSGQEFIDLIEAMPAFRPGCVILDVQMPGLNGLDLQDRLAAMDRPFPIVFITAHDEAEARERALSAGAVAFLRKPFSDELLIKTLDAALKREGSGRPGRGTP